MNPSSPFDLVGYFYTSSFVMASKDFAEDRFQNPDLDVKTSMHQDPEDPTLWTVGLYVGLPEKTDLTTVPYDFGISVVGSFLLPEMDDLPEESLLPLKKILYVNGSSILYSAVRDHIRTITATGPYPPFVIPTYRFDPENAPRSIEQS